MYEPQVVHTKPSSIQGAFAVVWHSLQPASYCRPARLLTWSAAVASGLAEEMLPAILHIS